MSVQYEARASTTQHVVLPVSAAGHIHDNTSTAAGTHCTRRTRPSTTPLQHNSPKKRRLVDSTHVILAAHVPAQLWNASAVLHELGRHPSCRRHEACTGDIDSDSHVDDALDVSILFGYSAANVKAATDFVVHGHIRPASVRVLSRLCLTTGAAIRALGGDSSRHHSFRAVIRRHLEYRGPRTGVWECVRGGTALVAGDVSSLECMAWSTAPWTRGMSEWLRGVPVALLCRKGWWWLVERALGSAHCSRVSGEAAFVNAADRGYLLMVKHLCSLPAERGVDPSAGDNDALAHAAANGHLQVVEYLCSLPAERGVDPSARNNYALARAAANGHLQVVEYLCSLPPERGVDPSARANYALFHADANGCSDVVEYLCSLPAERGVDPAMTNRACTVM